jgi:hypothetical protein
MFLEMKIIKNLLKNLLNKKDLKLMFDIKFFIINIVYFIGAQLIFNVINNLFFIFYKKKQ